MPGLVSPELGEREPTRHLHSVLVLLGGHGAAAQGTDECRHDSNRPHAFALLTSSSFWNAMQPSHRFEDTGLNTFITSRLTFELTSVRKRAKPAVARQVERRVRRQLHCLPFRSEEAEAMTKWIAANAADPCSGFSKTCSRLAPSASTR